RIFLLFGIVEKLTVDQTAAILEDCLYNILHDTILEVHREEKILRMQSAVIIAEKAAASVSSTPGVNGDSSTTDTTSSSNSTGVKVTTSGAVYEDGKVYLKGNPLKTTTEIFCPNCKLPRLLHPTSGNGSQPIPDPSKEYCAKYPFIDKPGHDIHGNPFPSDKAAPKNSKPRKNGKAPEKTSPPSSSDTLTGTPPDAAKEEVAVVSFPTVKCPNCPRYLIVTRIAQHLDKCLGISGRQSSRNAMKRMTDTPRDSRAGTPALGKRKKDVDDTDEDTPKQKTKRVVKKKAEKKPAASKTTEKGEEPQNKARKKTVDSKSTKDSKVLETRDEDEARKEFDSDSGKQLERDLDQGVDKDLGTASHLGLENALEKGKAAEEDAQHDTGA
ncbi:MAG: hypothetical protein M1830_003776, partial [Pleopsidium flavum]